MTAAADAIKALTPPDCWDDELDMPFRWYMPDNPRSLRVEVDEDGDVAIYAGTCWTTQVVGALTAVEARWLRDVWPALLLTVDAYTGVPS
ncbi:hypothetical protein [Gordonia soli]|uniref:Uncharacterized protein n=1 Tax=Gordonia soli NBRC 108243 TaxID=1223545 RepID=M0QQY0_9ACTN|nr:hypothetical protein [Gordonia soli]GAC71085.1 hypothetical protein GS4_51_00230 [Gordonia soli NBRC 108243]